MPIFFYQCKKLASDYTHGCVHMCIVTFKKKFVTVTQGMPQISHPLQKAMYS